MDYCAKELKFIPALKRLAEGWLQLHHCTFDSDTKPRTVKSVRCAEKLLAEHEYGCENALSVTGREPGKWVNLKGMDDFINNKDIEGVQSYSVESCPHWRNAA